MPEFAVVGGIHKFCKSRDDREKFTALMTGYYKRFQHKINHKCYSSVTSHSH